MYLPLIKNELTKVAQRSLFISSKKSTRRKSVKKKEAEKISPIASSKRLSDEDGSVSSKRSSRSSSTRSTSTKSTSSRSASSRSTTRNSSSRSTRSRSTKSTRSTRSRSSSTRRRRCINKEAEKMSPMSPTTSPKPSKEEDEEQSITSKKSLKDRTRSRSTRGSRRPSVTMDTENVAPMSPTTSMKQVSDEVEQSSLISKKSSRSRRRSRSSKRRPSIKKDAKHEPVVGNATKKNVLCEEPEPRNEVSRMLSKLSLVDSNAKNKATTRRTEDDRLDYIRTARVKEDALQSLNTLWARLQHEDYDTVTIIEDFVSSNGIPKLLEFLMQKNNVADPKCVSAATLVLIEFLFLADQKTKKSKTRKLGYQMAREFVKRKGIRVFLKNMLLLKFEERNTLALGNIWRVLGRVINKRTLRFIDRQEQLIVIDAANFCFYEIGRLDDSTRQENWVEYILRPLLFAVGNTVSDTTTFTKEDFLQKGVVGMSLGALKGYGDDRYTENKTVLENALYIFTTASTNGLLSSEEDLVLILPFCKHSLAMSKRGSRRNIRQDKEICKNDIKIALDSLRLLEQASSKVALDSIEKFCLLEACASFVKSCYYGEDESIELQARAVMRKITSRKHAISD